MRKIKVTKMRLLHDHLSDKQDEQLQENNKLKSIVHGL